MFVRTERLFLRPAWPEDFDDIASVISDGEASSDNCPVPVPRSADDFRACLEKTPDPRLPQFFVYLRAPGGPQLVGSIGLGRRGAEVEVGYWIAARHRGRGFAVEALRAVVNQARALGHKRVLANDFHERPETHDVLESAGFHDTGQDRSIYHPVRAMEYAARVYVAELAATASVKPVSLTSAV